MLRSVMVVLATSAVTAFAVSQQPARAGSLPETVTLSAMAPSPPPRFGEPVCITIVLANASAQDLWYIHAAPSVDFTYNLVDEHGERVRYVGRLHQMSNPNDFIPAHGEKRIPVRLDAVTAIAHPGTYTLNLSTTLFRRPPAASIPVTAKPLTFVIENGAALPPTSAPSTSPAPTCGPG